MKAGDPEWRYPFALLSRHGLEPPSLDIPVYRIKITRDLNRPRRAIGVPQYPAVRRDKTWVQDRELEEPVWAQDPMCFPQRASLVGHIHHRHERRHEVERVVREGQSQRIGNLEDDAERIACFRGLCMPNEG